MAHFVAGYVLRLLLLLTKLTAKLAAPPKM